jgi:putative phage-type endonuclease
MSTILQLVQGSAEWYEHRRGLRNASETPAVLGISPWATPYQLWLQKTGRAEAETNEAMRHGTAMEPLARHAYEVETGNVMQPLVLQDGPYCASLDGLTLEGELLVEIKAPLRGRSSTLWRAVAEGQVPEHYRMQIQHQLMVSGARLAHLWVFDGERGLLCPLEPDEAAWARIREGWDAFMPYVERDTPPPLGDGDCRQRQDLEWQQAAVAYLAAKTEADAAAARLEATRACLVGLASHPKETGGGVSVTRYWRAGAVDYKRVPGLQGVDLEQFRAQGRWEARVGLT